MKLVVDANVLLAAFLKEATTRELLLDSRLTLFAPEHLLFETARHLKEDASLRKRIRLTREELQELFEVLTQGIETVPFKSYEHWLHEALSLAPHKEDAPYLALALAMNIRIWSNDRGLRNQSKVRVYSTSEMVKMMQRR